MSIYYTVYLTTNLVNQKIYVGAHQTKNPNDSYLGSGPNMLNAIKKHGKKNFRKDVLFIFDNRDDMFEMEARIVDAEFVSRQDNYNGIPGGMGGKGMLAEMHPMYGKSHSDEAKLKMSAAKTGANHHNYGQRGEGMPMFGKSHSEDAKERIRQANIGNSRGKGYKHTDEAKAAMSKARSGHLHPLSGKPVSEETRRKMSETYQTPQPILSCPYCDNQSRNKANMNRYHFDACKYKDSINILEV